MCIAAHVLVAAALHSSFSLSASSRQFII